MAFRVGNIPRLGFVLLAVTVNLMNNMHPLCQIRITLNPPHCYGG